jgi:outer membrane lipoprotein
VAPARPRIPIALTAERTATPLGSIGSDEVMHIRMLAPLLVLAVAGCATSPKALQGQFDSQSPQDAAGADATVRWGGIVIEVVPQADRTCFQILSRELSGSGRPRLSDASEGRFLACRAGFYDPAVFSQGREVTVVGMLDGSERLRVGEFELQLPRIAASIVYLWPERVDRYYYDRPDLLWFSYGFNRWYGPSIRYRRIARPLPAPATPSE